MLITEPYRAEQTRLHETTDYGVASLKFAPAVSNLIDLLEVDTLLDYGSGRGRLAIGLRKNPPKRDVAVEMYDPAVPEFAGAPDPAELVVCIDVLEHIEPELLENVLDDLERLATAYVFLTIHTGPAQKTLSDGRNAHLTQQPAAWWMPKLMSRWEMLEAKKLGQGFVFIGKAH